MNIESAFYGNQFTHQLGYALYMEIEELVKLCSTPSAPFGGRINVTSCAIVSGAIFIAIFHIKFLSARL